MDLLEKIKGEIKIFEEKKKALVEELRKEFPALILPFLSQSKRMTGITWSQYTPYFADGDDCIFSVNEVRVNPGDDDDFDSWEDPDWLNETIYKTIENKEERIEAIRVANLLSLGEHMKKRKIGEGSYFLNPDRDIHECEVMKNIRDIITNIPDDFMKDLFGDHVEVIIMKDGTITTEEYEHD